MTHLGIGITGHRPHKLPANFLPAIDGHLQLAMHMIDLRFSAAELACVVSLAEGADTMAAEKAIEFGWKIVAPLPFPADDYAKDFEGEALQTFLTLLANAESFPCTPGRAHLADVAEGYRAASHAMLDRSHGLIAVWNGEATPLIGGAYDTIREALTRCLPVLWVHAASYDNPQYLTAADLPAIADGAAPAGAGGEEEFLAAMAAVYSAAG